MIGKALKYLKSEYNVFWILTSAFIFRLFIANFGTLDLDHGTFVAWANNLATNGLKDFYSGWSDYFPGYLYVLWLLGKINLLLPSLQTLTFKLPAIIADIATGLLIYKIVLKIKNEKVAIFSTLLYVFNPAIFSNSSLWGQVDSLTSLFSMLSIYLFSTNYYLSAITLSIGTLIKPQAAFILPAILYLMIVNKTSIQKILSFGFLGFGVFVLGFFPFNNQSNLFEFILSRFSLSANQYPYGSVNAFSFWALFGFWKPDQNIVWIGLGISIFLIILTTIILLKKKIKAGEYLIAGVSLLITFMFVTRMHERHLLPSLAPILVAASVNNLLYIAYGLLSFTYSFNLYYAYVWITKEYKEVFNLTLIRGFIALNLSALVAIFISVYKTFRFKFEKLIQKKPLLSIKFKTPDFSEKKVRLLLFLVLLFSILVRVYSLGTIKEMYFDEIYHSFTAKLMLHNDPKAWEWWNPHPEGFAYEWTHPPLSKMAMVVGMKIFGENSFGWRIPQAVAGTFSIFVIYLLAYEIFRDRKLAIFSAAIFSLDGLMLVLSRMGMNDVYVLLFAMLSVLSFVKSKNVWSAFFFGLAIASKWSAIYTLPILFVSHFVFKKKIKLSYLAFLILPIAIYIASYSQMFTTGHTWSQFIEVQKQMWWYHTSLVAEHPYTSPAWSWPLLLRPIYLYDGQTVNGLVARIYAFGNPFIFWFGLFSIILASIISFQEKLKKLGFIVFSYLVLFLPWIASPRIMFLYHYLPSMPFLVIASAFILRRFPKASVYILTSSFLCFVYFYPHWTGIRIPLWLDESYYWFSSWR